MALFVDRESIVRKIWGSSDTILFIFAGASAEFALNKAVDWLYFTGRLPADPLGRLFSTVMYAREIVFSEMDKANKAIDRITAIHRAVEESRGSKIPDWAYRDVLFMLIHYSQAAFELLERKMTEKEKDDLFDVFHRVGTRMELNGLPGNYPDWTQARDEHLQADLARTHYTTDLFKQYRKHLGWFRYNLLIESQKLVVPRQVKVLMSFSEPFLITLLLRIYKFSRRLKIDWFLKSLILPKNYKVQIKDLDVTLD